jgi:hypothetical protein
LEHKTARETLKRNDRAVADASYMSGLIFPDKHLQERYYSILPFLARHGVRELMVHAVRACTVGVSGSSSAGGLKSLEASKAK